MTATTVASRYSVLPYLKRRHRKLARRSGYSAANRAAHARWRQRLLATLADLTGYASMTRCPLKPRITEEVPCEGYLRQRIELQTEPGVIMPLYALLPTSTPGPWPAVITPHGHGSGGKFSPAGRRDLPEIAKQIETYNYDYAVQFARAGVAAFAPDARGFGERQEELARTSGLLASSCQWLNQMAYPLGQTVTGMWTWDLVRLVDYVQSRSDCLPDRVGCAGLSGGGLQTLWATAFDPRIRAAVVSGYFYGYEQSLLEMHGNCSCNYVPHLYEHADMGDIAALIAPRPLLIETGDADPLNGRSGLANVRSQLAITRKAYRLLGAPRSLVHDVFAGGHRWNGKVALPWMIEQLHR